MKTVKNRPPRIPAPHQDLKLIYFALLSTLGLTSLQDHFHHFNPRLHKLTHEESALLADRTD